LKHEGCSFILEHPTNHLPFFKHLSVTVTDLLGNYFF
jgi:hypothetical protein